MLLTHLVLKQTHIKIKQTPLIWAIMILYIPLTRQAMEILICRDMDGKSWMSADSTVQCSADVFLYFVASALAAVMILIMTLGFPVIMYRLLYRQRHQLQALAEIKTLVKKQKEEEIMNPEEFLQSRYVRRTLLVRPLHSIHCGYSNSYFYFELIEILRKLLLCVGFGLLWPDSQVQVYIIILIQLGFILFHQKEIYESKIIEDEETDDNAFAFSHIATLHVISMLFHVFNLFAATLYMNFPSESISLESVFESFDPPRLDQYFGLLLIVCNCIFLLSIVWMMISISKKGLFWCLGLYSRYDPKNRSLQQQVKRKKTKKKSSGRFVCSNQSIVMTCPTHHSRLIIQQVHKQITRFCPHSRKITACFMRRSGNYVMNHV